MGLSIDAAAAVSPDAGGVVVVRGGGAVGRDPGMGGRTGVMAWGGRVGGGAGGVALCHRGGEDSWRRVRAGWR